MKKNILMMAFILMFSSAANAADKVHVEAVEPFSTVSPTEYIDVKVISPANLDMHLLYAGDIIHCKVVEIIKPKRGKRSASFKVTPIYYISNDKKFEITEDLCGKYSEKVLSTEELKNVDAKKVGKKAVITVGNHFVKGVAPVASMAEGMIKNEDGNRLESGVKQVYRDSVFSYAGKGKQLDIKVGEQFYLIFKSAKTNDIDENIN